jgi:hypothetical protein
MERPILQKIIELQEFAEKENEQSVNVVLFALSGAIRSGDENLLASIVLSAIKDVLLPKVKEKQSRESISDAGYFSDN